MKSQRLLCKVQALALFGCTLLLAWGAPAWSAAALPAKWSGVVTQVLDGDTVQVRPSGGGKPVRVRIDGIDAPEICQTGGYLSRDALKRRSLGQRVMVHGRRHDDYGRLLARIVLKGEDQGQWMVAQGLAWSYRYRGHAGPYALQQGRAQAAQRGLFSPTGAAPAIHPRVFRQQHGSCYF